MRYCPTAPSAGGKSQLQHYTPVNNCVADAASASCWLNPIWSCPPSSGLIPVHKQEVGTQPKPNGAGCVSMKQPLEIVFIVMIKVYVPQQNSPVIPTCCTALTSRQTQMNMNNFILEENQTLAKIQPEKQKEPIIF